MGNKTRSCWLTGFLVLILIISSIGVLSITIQCIIHSADKVPDPSVSTGWIILGLLVPMMRLAGAIGMIKWKRWGFFCLFASAIINMGIIAFSFNTTPSIPANIPNAPQTADMLKMSAVFAMVNEIGFLILLCCLSWIGGNNSALSQME